MEVATVPVKHRDLHESTRPLSNGLEPTPKVSPHYDKPSTSAATRGLWALAALIILLWGLRLWGYVTLAAWATPVAVVLILMGIGGIILALLPDGIMDLQRRKQLGWILLVAALIALAVWSYFQVFTLPAYGTDEIAFDQYAAQLAIHGINPYMHSMAPAFPLFHVSPNGYTFTLRGRPITSLSYPALSFEPYMPLIALGIKAQAAIWVNVAAWGLTGILLYALMPADLCALAIVLTSVSVYIAYAVGGVTGALFIPLLIGAAYKWDRFATEKGWRAWLGPACLGLAMCVKQTPWLVGIFLVLGVAMEAMAHGTRSQALKTTARYVAIAALAFIVPNLPYLLSAPGAWLKGILTPLGSHVVPAGQGLVALSLYLGLGGGSIGAYSLLAIVVLVVSVACFIAFYGTLKPLAFFLPVFALFFATRSFGSYFVMLLPAAVIAALSTKPARDKRPAAWWPSVAVGGLGAIGVATAFALLTPSPMGIRIVSVHTTGQLATVDRLNLNVSNHTSHPIKPRFTLESGSGITAFWLRDKGPATLGAHRSAQYVLFAPNFYSMPSIAGGFQVLAFLTHPASLATSAPYIPTTWHLSLRPNTVNHPVPVGSTIIVKAEIENRFDQRVRVSHIPVYLGQIIYAQRGLEFSQAVVNGSPPGQTPVESLTNSQGIATFRISDTTPGSNPVYFEANLVNSRSYYPYGYSSPLAIRFVKPGF